MRFSCLSSHTGGMSGANVPHSYHEYNATFCWKRFDCDNVFSRAHSHGEYLWQVSLKCLYWDIASCEIGVTKQTDGRTDRQRSGHHFISSTHLFTRAIEWQTLQTLYNRQESLTDYKQKLRGRPLLPLLDCMLALLLPPQLTFFTNFKFFFNFEAIFLKFSVNQQLTL